MVPGIPCPQYSPPVETRLIASPIQKRRNALRLYKRNNPNIHPLYNAARSVSPDPYRCICGCFCLTYVGAKHLSPKHLSPNRYGQMII